MLEVISSHNYKLDTPPGIHDIFHISLLKRAADNPFPNQCRGNFRPPVIMVDGEEEWEVERVLRERVTGLGPGYIIPGPWPELTNWPYDLGRSPPLLL